MSTFDETVGLGEVTDDADGTSYPFHCTQITDGTRRIAEGSRVAFVIAPGLAGRWEGAALTTLAES